MKDGWAVFYKTGEKLSDVHETLKGAILNLVKMQIALTILSNDNNLYPRVVIDCISNGERQNFNHTENDDFGLYLL